MADGHDHQACGKKAVGYVGNLRHDLSEDALSNFVKQRCAKIPGLNQPKIYNCKIFNKASDEEGAALFCGARLTVDHASVASLCSREFWPGRSYARPWIFKDS